MKKGSSFIKKGSSSNPYYQTKTSVYLERDVYEIVKQRAHKEEKTYSAYIRSLILKDIQEQKEGEKHE